MFFKKKKIAVIGLGIIGSRVAENLLQAGYETHVWSRTPKSGFPNFASSIGELTAKVDGIQIFVDRSEALLEIVQNMTPFLHKGQFICNHATVDLDTTLSAAKLISEKEALFFDMPFTGSKLAAQAGEICYYLGGDVKEFSHAREIIEVSAKKISHVGKVGSATVLKIATNLMASVTVGALAEALALTRANDLGDEDLQKSLVGNAADSVLAQMKLKGIISEDFDAHFSLQNMIKDGEIACRLADANGVAVPTLRAVLKKMYALESDENAMACDFSIIASKEAEELLNSKTSHKKTKKTQKPKAARVDILGKLK